MYYNIFINKKTKNKMTKKTKLGYEEVEPLILKNLTKHYFNTLGTFSEIPWKKEHKNIFIIALVGFYSRIGRVVQVRKNFSDMGLDAVILRLGNGELKSFIDCKYYIIKKEHNKEAYDLLEKFFSNIPLDDSDKKKVFSRTLKK